MKKKYLIILLILPLIFSGCKKTNSENANSNQEAPKNSIQSEKVEAEDTSTKENKVEEKYNVVALTRNISIILKEIMLEEQ